MRYQEQKKDKKVPYSWAKGIKKGAHILYHPYTIKGFKFDCEK